MKRFIATFLAIVLCASASLTAFAAEPADEITPSASIDAEGDSGIMPLTTDTYTVGNGPSFVQVVNVPSGIPGDVGIVVLNFEPNRYRMDIMMYGPDGLVWQEEDCLHNESSRTFLCGPGVTRISIRIVPRSSLFPAPAKAFTVRVTY